MTDNEPNEVVVTLRHVDPRLVAALCRAAELAAEHGHWLGREHLIAALTDNTRGEQTLFEKWWPRHGTEQPDPYNGYPNDDPATQFRPITAPELHTVAQQMIPPTAPNVAPTAGGPTVDYTVSGPDGPAYRALIEGPDPTTIDRPRRYADYRPDNN
ncbi:hypothetical protein [Nocardia noduli]|uniref:hypothetical protein n=1 Tax=Nocardia noduli TaxID=2815722 RepID=UPI001C21608A|nr:hypothetical protein [Nocardia noduli]